MPIRISPNRIRSEFGWLMPGIWESPREMENSDSQLNWRWFWLTWSSALRTFKECLLARFSVNYSGNQEKNLRTKRYWSSSHYSHIGRNEMGSLKSKCRCCWDLENGLQEMSLDPRNIHRLFYRVLYGLDTSGEQGCRFELISFGFWRPLAI